MLPSINILRPVGNHIELSNEVGPHQPEIDPFLPFWARYYSSGTAALAAAMLASGNKRPDTTSPEVILPAYGCPDLVSAAVYAGLKPVLVDLVPGLPFMDLDKLQAALNPQTVALVAVRFFGLSERNKELKSIAQSHDLTFIEDSAQGFPVVEMDNYWNGDYVILSFGRGKPINLLGGGAVLSKESSMLEQLEDIPTIHDSLLKRKKHYSKLRIYNAMINPMVYGMISRIPGLHIGQTIYEPLHEIGGINNITFSMLPINLKAYMHRSNSQCFWSKVLGNHGSDEIIDIPRLVDHDMRQPLLRYPILIRDKRLRDRLFEQTYRYGSSVMYQKPLEQIKNVRQHLKPGKQTFENAQSFANSLLTLPTHEGVDKNIISIFSNAFSKLVK